MPIGVNSNPKFSGVKVFNKQDDFNDHGQEIFITDEYFCYYPFADETKEEIEAAKKL